MIRPTFARFVWMLSYSTLLLGCAAPPTSPSGSARSPEQIVQMLDTKKLSARGESDVSFGLAGLRDHVRPAIDRCRADAGDFIVLSRTAVQFAAKPNGAGLQQAQRMLPTKFACQTSSAFLWGAAAAYVEPTFFPSQWTNENYFYANMRLAFLSGASLERTEPTSVTNREAQRRVNEDCSARRLAYTQRLRASPQIGMEVAFGTIIDLKPTMALVQYNAFGRQMKGLDQEWVQVSSLSAGSNCPN
jgi:hypothetical protein